MASQFGKYIWIVGFLILGVVSSYFIYPLEQARVEEQLIGYPGSNVASHQIRPYLLVFLCFIPALAALLYRLAGTLDRYLTMELLRSFGICFGAFFSLLILMEVQNHGADVADASTIEIVSFYLIQLPAMLMMILPYSLMLSLLWCLGKMSKSQEIVSMVQSGRSLFRLMVPLIVSGIILTIVTLIFSYHWAPFAEGYKRAMLRELKGEPETAARNVGYQDPDLRRMWTVGRFPRNFNQGEPLEKVTIKQVSEDGLVEKIYEAETAVWSKKSSLWHLTDVTRWNYIHSDGSRLKLPVGQRASSEEVDFQETPWQIIRPALEPTHLGIPELDSWIKNHPDHPLSNKRKYQTWWHFRWAHPLICIIIVLLAAPLGISFTRRGSGGGIAVAISLCAGMLFCSTVFPTLGESGHLSPPLAAWATNILFASVAVILFYRRASGLPIYQVIRKFLPFK